MDTGERSARCTLRGCSPRGVLTAYFHAGPSGNARARARDGFYHLRGSAGVPRLIKRGTIVIVGIEPTAKFYYFPRDDESRERVIEKRGMQEIRARARAKRIMQKERRG